jgi:hypothetical protein
MLDHRTKEKRGEWNGLFVILSLSKDPVALPDAFEQITHPKKS